MQAALCAELAERIGAERFDLWFGAQTRLCVDERRLTVRATNAFVRDWLKKHFAEDIRACWEAIAGDSLPIEFDIEPRRKTRQKFGRNDRERWRLRVTQVLLLSSSQLAQPTSQRRTYRKQLQTQAGRAGHLAWLLLS